VTSVYWGREFLGDGVPQWAVAAAWFVLIAASVAVGVRCCRRPGWGAAHRLALAGGALLTYSWVGFSHARDMDVPRTVALTGNIVFGVGALVLLAISARAVRERGSAVPGSRSARGAARAFSACDAEGSSMAVGRSADEERPS
jgi:hypothetical protein